MQQFHTQEYPAANRNYKDRLFRFVFKNKKDLLDLYNAINGTDYDNPEELEVNTLENVLYLSMKNGEINIYSSSPKEFPFPQHIVFYNGTQEEPDRKILKLSDLFRRPNGEKEPCLECQTLMLNINYGHNRELMKKCRRLEEYAIFVDTIRKNQAKGQELQEAVETAVESCIAGGVLADILRAQKAEVVQMVLEGFDQEAYEKAMKKEGYEDGYQEGKEDGYQEGIEQGIERGICGLIRSLKEFDIPKEQILQKLQDTYELTEEEARGCIEKYW